GAAEWLQAGYGRAARADRARNGPLRARCRPDFPHYQAWSPRTRHSIQKLPRGTDAKSRTVTMDVAPTGSGACSAPAEYPLCKPGIGLGNLFGDAAAQQLQGRFVGDGGLRHPGGAVE